MSIDSGLLNVLALGRFPPVNRRTADAVIKRVPEGVATVLPCATVTQRTAHPHVLGANDLTAERRGNYSHADQVGKVMPVPLSIFRIRHSMTRRGFNFLYGCYKPRGPE